MRKLTRSLTMALVVPKAMFVPAGPAAGSRPAQERSRSATVLLAGTVDSKITCQERLVDPGDKPLTDNLKEVMP